MVCDGGADRVGVLLGEVVKLLSGVVLVEFLAPHGLDYAPGDGAVGLAGFEFRLHLLGGQELVQFGGPRVEQPDAGELVAGALEAKLDVVVVVPIPEGVTKGVVVPGKLDVVVVDVVGVKKRVVV